MKRKEVDLADKFGFKLFCADYSTVNVDEYVQFLGRSVASASSSSSSLFVLAYMHCALTLSMVGTG
jgi:hypothetical protein